MNAVITQILNDKTSWPPHTEQASLALAKSFAALLGGT